MEFVERGASIREAKHLRGEGMSLEKSLLLELKSAKDRVKRIERAIKELIPTGTQEQEKILPRSTRAKMALAKRKYWADVRAGKIKRKSKQV